MKHDLSHWPLVLSISEHAPTLDDLQAYSAAWSSWLDRSETFVTLRIITTAEAQQHPAGGARERKDWFEREGERLKSQVLAMATVAPAELVEKANRIDAKKLYGIPSRSFLNVDEALDWLDVHLSDSAAKLDRAAIKERVGNE